MQFVAVFSVGPLLKFLKASDNKWKIFNIYFRIKTLILFIILVSLLTGDILVSKDKDKDKDKDTDTDKDKVKDKVKVDDIGETGAILFK